MRFITGILMIILCACNFSSSTSDGNNKNEFAKVLEYYSANPKDSMKLKAAKFLISNLNNRVSFEGRELSTFFRYTDSISKLNYTRSQLQDAIDNYYNIHNTYVGLPIATSDYETLTASLLISNIELAVKEFQSKQWTQQISFETFCEYVLPYKNGNEKYEEFRSKLSTAFGFNSINSVDIISAADSILAKTSKNTMELVQFQDFVPDFPLSNLLKLRAGTCKESTSLAIYIMRSLGIPVAIDFTPQWAHRGNSHTWCALILDDKKSVDFEGVNAQHVGGHILPAINRLTKVYRQTFTNQPNSLAMIHGNEEIPSAFDNANLKDVSDCYFEGVNLEIPFDSLQFGSRRFLYLCVFDNQNWKPVAWAKIEGNSAKFDKLGKDVVYLPALYKDGEFHAVAEPILIDSSGKKMILHPDAKKVETVLLTRKYPVMDWWDSRTLDMIGGKFQVSNDSTFKKGKDIYVIRDPSEMKFFSIKIQEPMKYRYLRYLAPDSSYGEIAEIVVFQNEKKLNGKFYSTEAVDPENDVFRVFDNNPLTYFQAKKSEQPNWIILDLGKEESISEVRFIGRNDDNFINSEDDYELFYWKDRMWRSMGVKKDSLGTQMLKFDGVPINSLLLLKDHTKGKEERIFTYEKKKQKWW